MITMLTMVTMMTTIWLHFGYSGTNVQMKNPLIQLQPVTFGMSQGAEVGLTALRWHSRCLGHGEQACRDSQTS